MNPCIQWPDETLPVRIVCAPGVLTGLEIAAVDGLLALPRIGLGVGGLLLGRQTPDRIEILNTVAIECSHSTGPAFSLTPEEIGAALGTEEEEGAHDRQGHDVVGWYCSKTSGELVMTDRDHVLFVTLCPKARQLVLLIQPSGIRATTAVFGFRESARAGKAKRRVVLGVPRELAWQELKAFEVPKPEEMSPVATTDTVDATVPVKLSPSVPAALPSAPVKRLNPTVGKKESVTDPPSVTPVEIPISIPIPVSIPGSENLFGTPDEKQLVVVVGQPGPWPLRLAVAGVLLAIIALAIVLTRPVWMPRSPIALIGGSDWTGRATFLWNADALRGQPEATLVMENGSGSLNPIHLDRAAVRTGWYAVDCQPGLVTATLVAGDLSDSVTVKAQAETYLPESGISK